MTPSGILSWFGPAFLLAFLLAMLLWSVARGWGAGLDGRHLLSLCAILFFLALTQTPLPTLASLDCTHGGRAPDFTPFISLRLLAQFWAWKGLDPSAWLGNRLFQATVMNVVIPALIGMALARHMSGRRAIMRATALGFSLSLLAETAQATGLFWLYPCAWRRFLVDDLIANTAGVALGFALISHLRRRRQTMSKTIRAD